MLRTRPLSTRLLSVALLAMALLTSPSVAAPAPESSNTLKKQVQTLIPAIEKYIESGMRDFDVPGLAIGIVVDDELVYAKGAVLL